MNKRIISFITIFSSITLFSIGFATWGIVEGNDFKEDNTNDEDIIVDNLYDLDSIGVSYDLNTYPVGTFTYIVDESNKPSLTSTEVLFTFIVDKNVIKSLEFDNNGAYYFEIEMYYEYSISNSMDIITSSTLLTSPNEGEIYVTNAEAISMNIPLIKEKTTKGANYRYSVLAYIPVKSTSEHSLYDLLFLNNQEGQIPLTISYNFTNPTNSLLENRFEDFKNLKMNFALSVREK